MLFKKKDKKFDHDSKNWYKDKFESVRQQRDILVAVTLISLFAALASSAAVMLMTPYKSVEPFVIQIDDKTGIVKRVDPVTRTEFTANEAIDRYFIAKYVQARETFYASGVARNNDIVRVMSVPSEYRKYRIRILPSNPESPANLLKNGGVRDLKFKNITYLSAASDRESGEKVVQVRFLLLDNSPRYPEPQEYHIAATITFKYANIRLTQDERYINPIGFLVTDYQREKEVIQ